jgi:aspartate aminotransferase
MRKEFTRRRAYTLARIRALPGIDLPDPGGAFYAFFNVSAYFGKPLGRGTVVANSTDFCSALLEEAHVALVTGDAFGAPGYVRLSFATSMEVLEKGCDRLAAFLHA